LIICPCCGAKLAGDQALAACSACGAHAVGPPLARPEHELPVYGRALAVGAVGGLLIAVLLVGTIAALIERQPFSLAFWNVVASAETAAWRLKLFALPLALLALWPSWRIMLTLRREPARFAGLRLARIGFALSAFVVLAIAVLIGVTVPERMYRRALAKQAAQEAVAYEISSVLLQYQTLHGTYPISADDLSAQLPPSESVARVVALLKAGAAYEPVSDIAALPAPGSKARPRRVAAVRVRNASLRSGVDDTPAEGLSFTSYKLVLPGPDKKLGTPDDITLRDGRIVATSPTPPARASQSSSSSNKP
jgi:hypothetical protein